MRKRFWLIMFLAAVCSAQQQVQKANPCIQQGCFFATSSASVAAAGTTTLTIQQPTTSGRQVTYFSAIVQCPGQSFSVDQSENGTAASATAGTAVALIPTTATARANVFTASNVGAGTATAPTLTYASGAIAVIDLSQRTTGLSGNTNNYSIKLTNTGSASCTGTVSIYWMEKI